MPFETLCSNFIAKLLLKNQQLKALNQPSTRDYRSVLHFMENDGGQLFEEESSFVYEKEDLITIMPGRENAWLEAFIERTLCRCKLTSVSDTTRDCNPCWYASSNSSYSVPKLVISSIYGQPDFWPQQRRLERRPTILIYTIMIASERPVA